MKKINVRIILLCLCFICLVAAIVLNYLDKDGWGWFLFAGLFFIPSTKEERLDFYKESQQHQQKMVELVQKSIKRNPSPCNYCQNNTCKNSKINSKENSYD